ncbi:unnamed protein product [Owenia fusiformis]|uniref:Uncharacterized protein n=1 Tax=Owenia fusiformis TaxID=6347 RepID=A0A8S4N7M3_OWEFU|nr:unnamed protein product [Owenia fusiformis]
MMMDWKYVFVSILIYASLSTLDACGRASIHCGEDKKALLKQNNRKEDYVWVTSKDVYFHAEAIGARWLTFTHQILGPKVPTALRHGLHTFGFKAGTNLGETAECRRRVDAVVNRCFPSHPRLRNSHTSVECDASNLYWSKCAIRCRHGYQPAFPNQLTSNCKRYNNRPKDSHPWSLESMECKSEVICRGIISNDTNMVIRCDIGKEGATCDINCHYGYYLHGENLKRKICRFDASRGGLWYPEQMPECRELPTPIVQYCPDDMEVDIENHQRAEVRLRLPTIICAPNTEPLRIECPGFDGKEKIIVTRSDLSSPVRVACHATCPETGLTGYCSYRIFVKATNPAPDSCPVLDPPGNGALACAPWIGRELCRVVCKGNFCLPNNPALGTSRGYFYCQVGNEWQPRTTKIDCQACSQGSNATLRTELFYTGLCSDSHTQDIIRKRFIERMSEIERVSLCDNYPGCNVDNVEVRCGRESMSKDDPNIRIRMNLNWDFAQTGSYRERFLAAEQSLNAMFVRLENVFVSGRFGLAARLPFLNLRVVKDSFTHGLVLTGCPFGSIPSKGHDGEDETQEQYCVKCGLGYFYADNTKSCDECPIGTYQNEEGQLQCKECQLGFTTTGTAMQHAENCTEINQCDPSPCLGNGTCRNSAGTFACSCPPTHTGSRCETEIFDCKFHNCTGNSTCEPSLQSPGEYICVCPPEYTGIYCEIEKVNGGWGNWTTWSPCTQECGGGLQWRFNECNNPVPSSGGLNCTGNSTEIRPCNTHECPVCKTLRRPIGGYLTCEPNRPVPGGNITCNISCPDRYAFSGPVLDAYECGPLSNYTWNHEMPGINDHAMLPMCTIVSATGVQAILPNGGFTFPNVTCSRQDISSI